MGPCYDFVKNITEPARLRQLFKDSTSFAQKDSLLRLKFQDIVNPTLELIFLEASAEEVSVIIDEFGRQQIEAEPDDFANGAELTDRQKAEMQRIADEKRADFNHAFQKDLNDIKLLHVEGQTNDFLRRLHLLENQISITDRARAEGADETAVLGAYKDAVTERAQQLLVRQPGSLTEDVKAKFLGDNLLQKIQSFMKSEMNFDQAYESVEQEINKHCIMLAATTDLEFTCGNPMGYKATCDRIANELRSSSDKGDSKDLYSTLKKISQTLREDEKEEEGAKRRSKGLSEL